MAFDNFCKLVVFIIFAFLFKLPEILLRVSPARVCVLTDGCGNGCEKCSHKCAPPFP